MLFLTSGGKLLTCFRESPSQATGLMFSSNHRPHYMRKYSYRNTMIDSPRQARCFHFAALDFEHVEHVVGQVAK
jgi:hypothetical protein